MGVPTVRRRLTRVEDGSRRVTFDALVAEEPLEIRLGSAGGGVPLSVTMRTPGNDFELAAGFLVSEGIVGGGERIRSLRYCVEAGPQRYNVLTVDVSGEVPPAVTQVRNLAASSSCGLCGKASIDAVRTRARFDVSSDEVRVPAAVLAELPGRLRAAQSGFDRTGGLHAAGLFDAEGRPRCVREDVGRHNAFDKVIGWAALAGELPLGGSVMLASGRASFELTQKALMAGVPVLAAVSAPSSLAVELAEEAGMTLVGFLRGPTMNVYAGGHRVV